MSPERRPPLAAVVPTLGKSPHLVASLEALRGTGEPIEIVVVDQGPIAVELPAGLADVVIRRERNLGFATGTNLGIAAARAPYVATVNDDALVEPGWATALLAALEQDPTLGAVQGVNLRLDDPERADGCGLAWNRRWQAIQVGAGEPAPARETPARELWGVSATAAIYRRSALEAAALQPLEVFDSALGSYYEDVELALRLRACGFRARLIPAARARHAGSATAGAARWRLVYRNRHLVLARMFGARYWRKLPTFLARDLIDLAQALGRLDVARAAGIVAGVGRGVWRMGVVPRSAVR